jgi:hypothetical protein
MANMHPIGGKGSNAGTNQELADCQPAGLRGSLIILSTGFGSILRPRPRVSVMTKGALSRSLT